MRRFLGLIGRSLQRLRKFKSWCLHGREIGWNLINRLHLLYLGVDDGKEIWLSVSIKWHVRFRHYLPPFLLHELLSWASCNICIYNDFAANLSDGSFNLPALLDAVGCRY